MEGVDKMEEGRLGEGSKVDIWDIWQSDSSAVSVVTAYSL